MKYGVKITYSWGDEEEIVKCSTKEAAWEKAKQLAIEEAEVASREHEGEVELTFEYEKMEIALHYTYDDEYCYYRIVKV